MANEHLNFSPEVELTGDELWGELQQMAGHMKKKTGVPLRQQREDMIVESLRKGLPSEVVYWQLRQFYQENKHNPTICTDRGKFIYLDLEMHSGKLQMYVGESKALVTVRKEDQRTYFSMIVHERYTYRYCNELHSVVRVPASQETLLTELNVEFEEAEGVHPILIFFSCGDDNSERSLCSLTVGQHRFGHVAV